MSVRLMTSVWDLDLPPGEKLVLLALADQANDEGRQCWPAVSTIARKSGQGERTVRRALADLEAKGHLTRDHRDGTSTQYHVHPCQSGTPAKSAPLPKTTDTPAKLAPKTSGTAKLKKATPSKAKRANKFTLPSDIPADEWADFEEMRKVTRKPMTDSIRHKCVARLRKLADAGYPPGDVLSYSTLNNYQGLFPPKDDHNGQSGTNRMAGSGKPAGRTSDGFINAIRDARAIREAVPWDANDTSGIPRLAGLG